MYLTKRQSQLLDFLRSSIAQNGYAPSLEEIAAHFELSSVGTVHKHLKALEDKGVIRRQWNRSRAIEVVGLMDGKARPSLDQGDFLDSALLSAGHAHEVDARGRRQTGVAATVPLDTVGSGNALLVH